jgi:acyl-CoA synthetase (AMP-forming)/AMP-acid ligase II
MSSKYQNVDLAQFPGTTIEPQFPSIGAFVRAMADKFEDRLVLSCFEDNETLSYRELETLSDHAARGLAAMGVSKGDRVAVMLPNRAEYPLVWVAIAKLGALMVPVPTTYTHSELEFIIRDSQATYLVIDKDFLSLFEHISDCSTLVPASRIVVRNSPATDKYRDWHSILIETSEPLSLENIGPDDPVGLQYTSGTTGSPKGCVVSQDYWMLLGRSLGAVIRSDIGRILSPNPFNYMNGRNLLLTAMERGAALFLARRISSTRFLGWIDEQSIDFTLFPQLILKQPERPNDRKTTLKEVAVSAMSADAHREVERRFGVISWELYGMTEIGAVLAGDSRDASFVGSGRLGVPMLGRAVSVRDETGKEVQSGESGELWVAGPSMTTQYFGRPEATAEVFVGEWFRTGDLVRVGDDGYLYFVGRLKDIVRRSNENISAKEVEEVTRELECIEDAAVVPIPDDARGEEVKIFIQMKDGAPSGQEVIDILADHYKDRLATFKRPRYFAFVEGFPRTPSNKIRKAALKEAPFSQLPMFDTVVNKAAS